MIAHSPLIPDSLRFFSKMLPSVVLMLSLPRCAVSNKTPFLPFNVFLIAPFFGLCEFLIHERCAPGRDPRRLLQTAFLSFWFSIVSICGSPALSFVLWIFSGPTFPSMPFPRLRQPLGVKLLAHRTVLIRGLHFCFPSCPFFSFFSFFLASDFSCCRAITFRDEFCLLQMQTLSDRLFCVRLDPPPTVFDTLDSSAQLEQDWLSPGRSDVSG